MKLLADEGVDSAIVTRLRSDGHDVVYVAELSPGKADAVAQVVGEHGVEMPGVHRSLRGSCSGASGTQDRSRCGI